MSQADADADVDAATPHDVADAPAALTAESIPLSAPPLALPGLVLTTHFAEDVGLVFTDGSEGAQRPYEDGDSDDGSDDGAAAAALDVDADTAAAMAALGLPTAFGEGGGGRRARRRRRGRRRAQEEGVEDRGGDGDSGSGDDHSAQEAGAGGAPPAGGEARGTDAHGAWRQALDGASGRHYYYNEALGRTQWEPPEGAAFEPCVGVWPGGGGAGDGEAREGGDGGLAAAAPRQQGVLLGGARPGERREGSGLLPGGSIGPGGCAAAADACAGGGGAAQHLRWSASDGEEQEEQRSGGGSGSGGAEEAPQAAAARSGAPAKGARAAAASASAAARRRRALPRAAAKYWPQRYSLFSRFDEGVRLDAQGWYSVTPEATARAQAAAAAAPVAVDAFAGCGGNAIQLAATCGAVIAIDVAASRLAMARHNAGVYGVAGRIEFVCADFFEAAPRLAADVVFLSPPWGGPHYRNCAAFDPAARLDGLPATTLELLELGRAIVRRGAALGAAGGGTEAAKSCRRGVVAFLPRNTDLHALSAFAARAGRVVSGLGGGDGGGSGGEGGGGEAGPPPMVVERAVLNGRLKGVTVYWLEEPAAAAGPGGGGREGGAAAS